MAGHGLHLGIHSAHGKGGRPLAKEHREGSLVIKIQWFSYATMEE